MKTFCKFVAAALILIGAAASSEGGPIVLGNLPPANDSFSAVIDSGLDGVGTSNNVRWAVSFTMPPQSFPVDRVTVRLSEYNTSAGDVAAVGFYLDNGSDAPGALFGSLLASPPSSNSDVGQFDFMPSGPLTLTASTKYWLMLDAMAGDFYQWNGSSPAINPTSQVGTSFGKQIVLRGNTPTDSNQRSSFEIVSTVPEPAANLLPLCFVIGFAITRMRQFSGMRSIVLTDV